MSQLVGEGLPHLGGTQHIIVVATMELVSALVGEDRVRRSWTCNVASVCELYTLQNQLPAFTYLSRIAPTLVPKAVQTGVLFLQDTIANLCLCVQKLRFS